MAEWMVRFHPFVVVLLGQCVHGVGPVNSFPGGPVFARNSVFAIGVAVVAALTAFAPVAKAAGGDPHAVTPQIQSLRAQVHSGTLLKSHGLKKARDACQAQIVTTGSRRPTWRPTSTPTGPSTACRPARWRAVA
jgi:hypothetical protein